MTPEQKIKHISLPEPPSRRLSRTDCANGLLAAIGYYPNSGCGVLRIGSVSLPSR
jgi:hypothetical protein